MTVRPLRSDAELRACVQLQRLTWGESFSELVPPSILKVCQRIGGVAAGAFDADDRLLGFVFGLTGVEGGRLVHWSDMLAVREEARDHGIGKRLKEYQRDVVRGLGVEAILWTYDPLVARNAHLNLNRLRAEVVEYVEDMYGESDSALHRGLGTDRFVVAWRIDGSGPAGPEPGEAAIDRAPVVNAVPGESAGGDPGWEEAPMVRVTVPCDIQEVQAASLDRAAEWRASTRRAFHACLERGYRVVGFRRDPAADRCHYLLARGA